MPDIVRFVTLVVVVQSIAVVIAAIIVAIITIKLIKWLRRRAWRRRNAGAGGGS